MKAQAGKSRAKQASAHRRAQSAPLTRLVVLDAIRSWVIPTVAIVGAIVVYVLYSVEIVEESFAVTTVGALALVVTLFYGLRSFTDESPVGQLGAALAAFSVLWGVTTFYPFYRAVNPGTPLFSTDLKHNGPAVTLPLHGKPNRYNMIVQGHFLPAEGQANRTATYRIAVGHGESTEHVLEGTFSQEWGSQRIGAGRRSSLVPVMRQTTQVLAPLDDPDGSDLSAKLTDLSPGVRDSVSVRIYTESIPKPVLIALGALAIAAAVLIDAWRPKGASEGLMATLTVATLLSVVVFRASAVATPGFPQLVVAALVGTFVGALAGSLLWRLTQPIRKYLPARP
jgi:hypothetical protein